MGRLISGCTSTSLHVPTFCPHLSKKREAIKNEQCVYWKYTCVKNINLGSRIACIPCSRPLLHLGKKYIGVELHMRSPSRWTSAASVERELRVRYEVIWMDYNATPTKMDRMPSWSYLRLWTPMQMIIISHWIQILWWIFMGIGWY